MSRPTDNPPLFATDAAYPLVTGKPWSLASNKTSIPTGKLARGFMAEKRLPGRWMNWLLNQITRRLDHVDLLEVLNFERHTEITATGISTTSQTCAALAWADEIGLWFVTAYEDTGNLPKVWTSHDGSEWVDITADISGDVTFDVELCGIAAYGTTVCMVEIASPSTDEVILRTIGPVAYAKHSIEATNCKPRGAFTGTPSFPFVIFGTNSAADEPRLCVVQANGTNAAHTIPIGSGIDQPLAFGAASPTHLMVGDRGPANIWSVIGDGSTTTWTYRDALSLITSGLRGLAYDVARDLFVAVDDDGNTYTSSDYGATWDGTGSAPVAAGSVEDGLVVTADGLWLFVGGESARAEQRRLFVTADRGDTWTTSPAPFSGAGEIVYGDHRLVARNNPGTPGASFRTTRTLRVK